VKKASIFIDTVVFTCVSVRGNVPQNSLFEIVKMRVEIIFLVTKKNFVNSIS